MNSNKNNFLLVIIFIHRTIFVVYRYDAERDTWIALPRMLQRRAYFQLIRSDGNLYAIGGIAENLLNNVEFYDGTRWQETSPMQTNRAGFGAAVYQNYIYALGGFIKSGKVYEDTDVVERFDMNTKKWTKVHERTILFSNYCSFNIFPSFF